MLQRSKFSNRVAIAAMLGLCTSFAAAQHSDDVILDVQDGRIVTGAVDDEDEVIRQNQLWTHELGKTFPNFTDHPGYDAEAGTFPQGTAVGISIRKALRTWNMDELHFNEMADPETMTIELFSLIETPPSDPEAGEALPSLHLATAGASGAIHVHPWYGLTEPHSDGVYLLELEVWADAPDIEPSEPLWIVFNQNMPSATIDDAVAWVEVNLISEQCAGDVSNDGAVNVDDLLMVLNAWGPCDGCPADVTSDDVVNVDDLLSILNAWGECR